MAHKNPLRKDKTCLNCNYVVDNRFCSNCGQENTDTRKTFFHLFVHFFEDLTHYENAFWKTIKNLLLRPASLTKEYLSGKRMSYLAPVRLYIFVSFITFFILSILPKDDLKEHKAIENTNGLTTTQRDSLLALEKSNKFHYGKYGSTVRELDSTQALVPVEKRLSAFQYGIIKKAMLVTEHSDGGEILEKFRESFTHNFPKVLFIYMPLFAFILWLFQDKKKWYYFDHGIFTLHYFSFLLLMFLILTLVDDLIFMAFGENAFLDVVSNLMTLAFFIWTFSYFFLAHHRFYKQTRMTTIIKGLSMFFINSILIVFILTIFAIYTFINLH
jgi:hypothetical protein